MTIGRSGRRLQKDIFSKKIYLRKKINDENERPAKLCDKVGDVGGRRCLKRKTSLRVFSKTALKCSRG